MSKQIIFLIKDPMQTPRVARPQKPHQDGDENQFILGSSDTGYWCSLCSDSEKFCEAKKLEHKAKNVVRQESISMFFCTLCFCVFRRIEETYGQTNTKKVIIGSTKWRE